MIRSQLLRGLTVEKVVDSMILKVGLGTDFFIEIAKIKALRILFFQLVQAYQYEAFEPCKG